MSITASRPGPALHGHRTRPGGTRAHRSAPRHRDARSAIGIGSVIAAVVALAGALAACSSSNPYPQSAGYPPNYNPSQNPVATASPLAAGDCFTRHGTTSTAPPKLEKLPCTSPDARQRVVRVIPSSSDDAPCQNPSAGASTGPAVSGWTDQDWWSPNALMWQAVYCAVELPNR